MSKNTKATAHKTGWPPGLLQDDDRKLSRWFASRPNARWEVRQVVAGWRVVVYTGAVK